MNATTKLLICLVEGIRSSWNLLKLAREVEFACDVKADGVACCGFASEWCKLAEVEVDCAAEIALYAAKWPVPVILNPIATETRLIEKQGIFAGSRRLLRGSGLLDQGQQCELEQIREHLA